MQRIYRVFWMLALLMPTFSVLAAQAELGSINYSASEQLIISLPNASKQHVFVLKNPHRLVVDFTDTKLLHPVNQPPFDHPLFSSARSGVRNAADLRLVIALKTEAEATAVLVGKDLQIALKAKPLPVKAEKIAAASQAVAAVKVDKPVKAALELAAAKPSVIKPVSAPVRGRDIVVAIDAGHGGKDVGAQGPNGVQEKDVVFAIAKHLEGLVNSQPGMKAVMIRKGDYFVKLNERRHIAHSAKADLFVSIHADAFSDSQAHGASVYTLANKGASSAAASWLAKSENAVDKLAGGDDRSETLASVLMDLSQTAAKEASQNVGNNVLKSVKGIGHLHRSSVQKAGFVVLKSADIPSILVETAFISNPEEERRLTTSAYQHRMASAVFSGIISHFRQYAPADTMMAQLKGSSKAQRLALARADNESDVKPIVEKSPKPVNEVIATAANTQHTINPGETLSGIAQQYGVSMRALRLANAMNDGNVRIGQVLQIPAT